MTTHQPELARHEVVARRAKHVRFVSWDDDPPVGGQGVYLRELRSALTRRGLQVSTVAGRGEHAVGYGRFTGRGHLDLSITLNRHPALLTEGDPDLVHVSGGPGGVHLLRRLRVPVVYTAHHTFRQAHRRTSALRVVGLVESKAYSLATAVAAVSPSTAEAVVAMGVPAKKVVVISPGVHVDARGISGEEREKGRLLFVGRLEDEKGPLDAVAVMDALASEIPWVSGYVVGSGSMTEKVRRAAANTSGRVSFLGPLTDDEVAEQFRRAEVVLVPSAFEGLGLVALEAMAAGAAVVGYEVSGLRDVLRGRAQAVPFGDLRALEAAALALVTNETFRDEIVGRCVEHVRVDRSWERCAAELEDLYGSVVDGRW